MKMEIEIQKFSTPNFVLSIPQPNETNRVSWPIREVDAQTLSKLCDEFRREVFAKAEKKDPRP